MGARRRALALLALLFPACGGGGSSEPGPGVPPPLPEAFDYLAPGFSAEPVLEGAAMPVRLAAAPDGRVFFNELTTGNVRVIGADGTLQATPFAHLDVIAGGHNGLLGLALAPDFASSGHVYVTVSTPGSGPTADRLRIVRFTDVAGAGTNETVLVDDLPQATINNGGDLAFGTDGTLFLSTGDSDVEANAQTDGSLAGRILRYTATGGIPADNPVSGSPEWCRGLRNTFATAVHPATGGLFGADNGPASDDELNFLQAGKNFGWPSLPPGTSGSQIGFRITGWTDVIVPTGLSWHDGTGWGAPYANNLFLTSYDDEVVRRFVLSGPSFADLDSVEEFARFLPDGLNNKPLDVVVTPGGDLLVSTFTAIWRIRKS